jgi:hypothetical protein
MTEFDTINSRLKTIENILEEDEKVNRKKIQTLRDELALTNAKLKLLEAYCYEG